MKPIVKRSGRYILGLLFVAAMVFGAFASASATPFPYGFVPVTWNQGEIVAGLAYNFSMEVEDLGDGKVGFKILSFLNNDAGGETFSITDIYFYDSGILDVGQAVEVDFYGNVAFSPEKVAPKNLPGLKTDVALAYSTDSDVPIPEKGVNVDEWISFMFFLEDGKSFDDALGDLDGGELLVGIHVQSFGEFSESFVSSPPTTPGSPPSTPVPAAFWLLGSGLLALVGLRRKFRG